MKEILDQLFFYLEALWRRRWQVSGIALMLAAAIWAIIASLPNYYTASARIYVDTGNVLGPLLRGMTVENDLNQQVRVMRQTLLSRPNLEEVARQTDMDIEASGPGDMEKMLQDLESRIKVEADRENLFRISYSGADRRLALEIVKSLTTLFVEGNLGQNRSDIDNAQVFLKRQVDEYEEKLNDAERKLARFKQDNLQFLPGQSGLQEELQAKRERLQVLRGQLQDAMNKRDLLRDELAATPEIIGQAAGGSLGPPTNIDVEIMEARSSLEQLKSRYTDQHPDVVTLQRRLDRLMDQKAAQGAGPGSGPADSAATVPNPIFSDLRMELIRTRSEVQALRDQIARSEREVEELQRNIRLVPEVEAELKRLTRDYDVIRNNYENLLSRQESARLTAERESQGSEFAFRMIESPELPSLPSGPNRPLFLIAGFFVSIAAACGVAWLLALARVTYGSVEHLRRDFDIPVIGSLSIVGEQGRNDSPSAKEWVKLSGVIALMIVSLAGLLLAESRIGLQTVTTPVLGAMAVLFAIGLTIFYANFRYARSRNPATPDTGGLAAQAS